METLTLQPPLLGESRAIDDLRDFIVAVSLRDEPVLLTGPAGTGKSLAAGKIHAIGPRATQPLRCFEATELDAEHIATLLTPDPTEAVGSILVKNADQLPVASVEFLQDVLFPGEGTPRWIFGSRFEPGTPEWQTVGDFEAEFCLRRAIPPLRERCEDIPAISRYQVWLHSLPEKFEVRWTAFEARILPTLLEHDWPGNVAELIATVVEQCGGHSGIPRRWAGEGGWATAQEEFLRCELEIAFEELCEQLADNTLDMAEWLLPRPDRKLLGECDGD